MKKNEVRIGLIGAGIFARDVHIPAWRALERKARVVAVWSRTAASAAARAAELPGSVDVVEELNDLLARPDIDAVDIVLPIDVQPAVVARALAAGKHVVSEKPIAPDTATARYLIARWRMTGLTWMAAENWRYEEAFVRAAALLRQGAIGAPITATWSLHLPMSPEVKYYHTAWRMSGQVKGGFIVDAGVHHIAALRMILGEIVEAKAFAAHHREDLPRPDTLAATFTAANGVVGHYLLSFAMQPVGDAPLVIMGSEGRLRVDRGWVEVTRAGTVDRLEVAGFDGVQHELAEFVESIAEGTPHRNTPDEALRDLAVIEAMLKSAGAGGLRVVSDPAD